jgi:hypothetical protein
MQSSGGWTSSADLPFQLFGLLALGILVLMAATSHDFWLHTLTAPFVTSAPPLDVALPDLDDEPF